LTTLNSISVINRDRQAITDHPRASSSERKIGTKVLKPDGMKNMPSSDFRSDDDHVNEYAQAPTFNGHRVAASTTAALPLYTSNDNDSKNPMVRGHCR
jgi:hypothetical protein